MKYLILIFLSVFLISNDLYAVPRMPIPDRPPHCDSEWQVAKYCKSWFGARIYQHRESDWDGDLSKVDGVCSYYEVDWFPEVQEGKECFIWGDIRNINDVVYGDTQVTFSYEGAGYCDPLPEIPLNSCDSVPVKIRCRGEGGTVKLKFRVNRDDDILFNPNFCCRDLDDEAHCQSMPDGICNAPSCNTGCNAAGSHGHRFYARDLIVENNFPQVPKEPGGASFEVRFPELGDPENTAPKPLPLTCQFEGYIQNAWTIHGDRNANISPRLDFLPRHGVTCTNSGNPFHQFVHPAVGAEKLNSSCSTVSDSWTDFDGNTFWPNEAHVYFDNGCYPAPFNFTCHFPEPLNVPACMNLNSDDHRKKADPHLYVDSNDSSNLFMKICCCEGDSAACCAAEDRPVLVE